MKKKIKYITKKELNLMTKNLDLRLYKINNSNKVILIVDNRYRIFIEGSKTSVEKEDNSMIGLKVNEMPKYIREFIFN